MRNRLFLLTFVLVLIGLCSAGLQKETAEAPPSLEGTWRLISYHDPSDPPGKWRQYEADVIYEKYITPTHFMWVRYETASDRLVGMGGGTYTYDGKNYVETIEFFMPATSSILGQQISFNAEFKDGKWYHTGYSKEVQFDPEEAQTVVVDSMKIEEIWQKMPATANNQKELQGTWKLVSYREKEAGPRMNYPSFVRYVKLITPTHFAWAQYNEDGDDISGAGCGTYTFDGKSYVENVKMIYPSGSPLTGSSITFNYERKGNRWFHSALSAEKKGQKLDSVFINEEWTRFRPW